MARMTTMPSALHAPLARLVRSAFDEMVDALASVRFAASLAGALALLALVGILVPQLPESARSDPTATAAWLGNQRQGIGAAADWVYRLELYDIFHSVWMAGGFALLALSIAACTARRFAPIWRTVFHPVKVVPDAFMEGTKSSVVSAAAVDPAALERELRRRHFRVERWEQADDAWLFADRYPWAMLSTFLSHVALVLLMAGVVVTHFGGFTSRLFIAEGTSEPVFPLGHVPGMNVTLQSATRSSDPTDPSVEYRSQIAISSNGSQVKTCALTASQPCSYNGYRIRQAFYFPYGADIEVRDTRDGRVLYRHAVALTATRSAPHLVVSDSTGKVVLDQVVAFTSSVAGVDGALVEIPTLSDPVWIGLSGSASAPRMVAFQPGGGHDAVRLGLALHTGAWAAGLNFQFTAVETTPAAEVADLPLSAARSAVSTPPVVQWTESAPAAAGAEASPVLLISGLGDSPLSLHEGERAVVGGLEYRFVRQQPFVGVEVKKDRGEPLIWAGSAMLVLGLCATLWIPRRRLWARVNGDGLRMAGMAPRLANLTSEMEALVTAAARAPRDVSPSVGSR
jgi:cytochrome c biogenesis protein